MTRYGFMGALILAGMFAAPLAAEDRVPTPGSDVTFAPDMEFAAEGKKTRYVLTGTGLREKIFINVYAVGSYLAPGSDVKDAAALAAADVPKIMLLVFEREVDGAEMLDGLTTGISYNYSPKTFEKELKELGDYMRVRPIKTGDQVWIVHVPGKGLRVRISGRPDDVVIPSMKFARAVWDIYLGPKNLGEHIKTGLVSRL